MRDLINQLTRAIKDEDEAIMFYQKLIATIDKEMVLQGVKSKTHPLYLIRQTITHIQLEEIRHQRILTDILKAIGG